VLPPVSTVPNVEASIPPPPPPPAKVEEEIAFENDDNGSQYGNKIVGSVQTIDEAGTPAQEGLSVGAIVAVAAAATIVAAALMALGKRRMNRIEEKELGPEYESQNDDGTFLDEEGVPPPPPMEA